MPRTSSLLLPSELFSLHIMSHPQGILKHSRVSQTSLDTDSDSVKEVKEPFTNSPREQPQKPFPSITRFHEDLIELQQRFLLTSLSLVLLVITLWSFSRLQRLSKWEQRSFNTISILATGMASLGLGSLLGYLGSMLRWPLLARTTHEMRDVDSILGMAPPTRSLRLIKRHVRERRISRTTIIVAAYFITNILGRLSVALFGLAFNLKDEKGIEYPILATNWTSASWTRNIDLLSSAPGAPKGYEAIEDFLSAAWNGMRE
ncbi:hypothetical protein B9Z19DRAFT_752771 [Tuber borchii]|uniref:Uncharacterized protein n=1 Tax=Tuber borchii TaxID=42251 RepID=A0A2T7A7R8_TUBBO|nr:hypothetical protein B9Z19DRAFT_752771 [Tuber borchii]